MLTLKSPARAARVRLGVIGYVSQAQSATYSHPQMNAALYYLAANVAADGCSTLTEWARL